MSTSVMHEAVEAILSEMREKGFFKYRKGKEPEISYDPTPWDINTGWCEEWANYVIACLPDAEALWLDQFGSEYDDFAHKIVVWRGRYYDAECPDGVDTLEDIPMIKNFGHKPS